MKNSFSAKIGTFVIALLGTATLNAATYDVTGNFSSNITGSTQGVTLFAGNFSFVFDDSATHINQGDAFGYTNILSYEDIVLDTLSLSTIGSTLFDTSNSLGSVTMSEGEVLGVGIYGDPDGSGLSSNTDDYDYYLLTSEVATAASFPEIRWTLSTTFDTTDFDYSSDAGIGGTNDGSFQAVSSVPVPAAAWLFGSALLGLGMVKRCKA